MEALLSILFLITGLTVTGLVASFSLILYATLMTALGSKQEPITKGFMLVAGVGCGLALLLLILLAIQPETFQLKSIWEIIGSHRNNTVDVILGVLLLTSGSYVMILGLRHKKYPLTLSRSSAEVGKRKGGAAALFGFGFARAITRATGVAALLLGIRTVSHATDLLSIKLLLLAVLLIAALIPYIATCGIRILYPSSFSRVERFVAKTKSLRPYKTTGVTLLVAGILLLVLSAYA